MPKHKHWRAFVWALLQQFGKECWRTWSDIVIVTLAGGVASAAAGYLQTHGKQSFTDALWNGIIGAGIVFGIYAIVHLIRSPWLEHKSDGTAGTTLQGVSGMVMLALLLVGVIVVCLSLADDLRATPPIILGSADPAHKKADDLIQLEECKATLASMTKPEAPDSLRRRTIKLVNELNLFWAKRQAPLQQPVQNPASDDDRARNAKWDRYWRETTVAYQSREFNQHVLGIVREYKNKGVSVGFLEQGAEQPERLIGSLPYGGFSLDNCDRFMSELCQLRELAFHVDAYDNRVDLSNF